MDAMGQDSAAPHLQVVTLPKAMVRGVTPFTIRTDVPNCAKGKAWKGFPANTSSFMVTQAFPGVFCTFSLRQSLSPKAPLMASQWRSRFLQDGDGTFASENFKLKHDRPGLASALEGESTDGLGIV